MSSKVFAVRFDQHREIGPIECLELIPDDVDKGSVWEALDQAGVKFTVGNIEAAVTLQRMQILGKAAALEKEKRILDTVMRSGTS